MGGFHSLRSQCVLSTSTRHELVHCCRNGTSCGALLLRKVGLSLSCTHSFTGAQFEVLVDYS